MRGYVYALINPALVGLVKVGRTDREPEARAQELSRHTGVPTPFVVAYYRLVEDSEQAEAYVHSVLDRRGYRLSESREFFRVPLHEVVDAVHSYTDPVASAANVSQGLTGAACTGDDLPDSLSVADAAPWQGILDEAEAHNRGLGEYLQDPVEAFGLYEQAARLGCPLAWRRLGEIYEAGVGASRSVQRSLASHKQAVSLGDYVAWAKMSSLFRAEGQTDNSQKCWKRFVDGVEAHLDHGGALDDDAAREIVGELHRAYAPPPEKFIKHLKKSRFSASEIAEILKKSGSSTSGPLYGEELFVALRSELLQTARSWGEFLHNAGCSTEPADAVADWLLTRREGARKP
jgi:hypothetical protein